MTGTRRLPGKVAVVTGAGSGIGLAVTELFLAEGASVVAFDRDPGGLAASGRPGLRPVAGDVRDVADNARAVEAALDGFGRLDVFVGNAGVHDGGRRLLDLPPAELDDLMGRVLDVNVRGYVNGARAAAEALGRARGCMIFTLSDASFHVSGNGAGLAYAAAKHAALGVVRALAAQLAPGVRVNAVAPGGVVTGLRAATGGWDCERPLFGTPDAARDRIRALNPLGSVLTPGELAEYYVFLARAVGLTGEVIRPDGGLSVR
jgi:2,3-dihydroxy-2,3-dihydrophenylpropionate dehydrogenase